MKKLFALLMVISIIITTFGLSGLPAANATALYSLTVASNAGGMVTDPGEGIFHELEGASVVDLVATADTGYHFVNWTGDTATIGSTTAATTTITMNGDYAITANFAKDIVNYNLTTAVNNGAYGSVNPSGTVSHYSGEVVTVNATANSGYHFVNWTGDTTAMVNPNLAVTTITMNAVYSITANFATNSGLKTLTVSAGANGSVNSASGTYINGQVVLLTATPNSGYHFVYWSGNTGTVNNIRNASTAIAMTGDYSVTANFAANSTTFTLVISSAGGGTVKDQLGTSLIGTFYNIPYGPLWNQLIPYPSGTNIFDRWTGDTWVLSSPYDTNSYGVTANLNSSSNTITLVAHFQQGLSDPFNTYINFSAGIGGTMSSPSLGEHAYTTESDAVLATASAYTGYQFSNWTGDYSWVIDSPNSISTYIEMINPNRVKANFTALTYNLTINAGSGGTTSSSGAYNLGQVVNVTASANSGYHFVNWTGNTATMGNPNTANTTITIANTAAYSITANFAANTPSYNLTTAAGSGGTVSAPGLGSQGPYPAGTIVSITASANTGYHFVNWTGDNSTITNTLDATAAITINAACSITANFAANTYDLNITAGDDGSVTTPGEGTFNDYSEGASVNLVAVPDSGYVFVNWTGNVASIANVNNASTTITMNNDYSIQANFTLVTYSLGVAAGDGGSVTTPGEGTFDDYTQGTVVNLVAAPDSGYVFVNWTGNVSTIANVNNASTNITMNSNYEIQANFTEDSGLRSQWLFDEGSGTVVEDPIGSNDGTVYNGAVPGANWTDGMGPNGYALSFDGNDYVQLPASSNVLPTGSFTIEAWFKTSTNRGTYLNTENPEQRIISLHRGAVWGTLLSVYVEQDNIGLLYWDGAAPLEDRNYTTNYSDDVWHHVVVTYDQTTIKLYYDGSEVISAVTAMGNRGSKPAFIGAYYNSARCFNGTIDEVQIFNKALSEQEVLDQYFVYFPPCYLTIDWGEGGSGTIPDQGTYPYKAGKVVNITAIEAPGYQFDSWTGDTDNIADVSSNVTTITMEEDYTITATFMGYEK